jgi:uncharacterized protein YbcI
VVPITNQPEDTEGTEGHGLEGATGSGDAREAPTAKQVRDEIAREILRIHTESYGKGASLANAIVGDDWVVVVLDDLELLPNEQFLVDHGKYDAVAHVRSQYQHAIQSSFRAAIERATGRKVVGFASTTSVEEPRFMAEVFKLE